MFRKTIFLLCLISCLISELRAQKVYSVSSGEFIFSFADVEINNINQTTGMRFSFFINYGHQWHMDLTKNIGLYTGSDIRNFGFKIKENNRTDTYRVYSLGIPVALKLGSFDEHLFLYGGGEYELFFHFKHKRIDDYGKFKNTSWFSNRVNLLAPSVFTGIQFPKGMNIKFTYYLNGFFNKDFSGLSFDDPVDYSEWKAQVFYITLCFNFKTSKYKEIINKAEEEYAKL